MVDSIEATELAAAVVGAGFSALMEGPAGGVPTVEMMERPESEAAAELDCGAGNTEMVTVVIETEVEVVDTVIPWVRVTVTSSDVTPYEAAAEGSGCCDSGSGCGGWRRAGHRTGHRGGAGLDDIAFLAVGRCCHCRVLLGGQDRGGDGGEKSTCCPLAGRAARW